MKTALERLNSLEKRVERLEAQKPQPSAPQKCAKADAYPRKVTDEAKGAILKAYNDMVRELVIPMSINDLMDRARKVPDSGPAVPSSVSCHTVMAVIAEHHGIAVVWSGRPAQKSLERTDDPRVVMRSRLPGANGAH